MSTNEEQVLAAAKKEAQRWVDVFKLDGTNYNKEVVLEELKKRTFEGEPCVVRLVDSPKQVVDAMMDGAAEIQEKETGSREIPEEVKKVLRQAHSCIWDYYDMAFYETAYSQLPNKEAEWEDKEFFEQSLFRAFEHGVGFIVNLGSLIIGVMRPIAYRDDDLRLHRETGPAVIWGNEEPEYWWHGTKIQKEWIENPESIDPKDALHWPNAEQRRCLCEIVGWIKILDLLDAKVIQEDKYGTLMEAMVEGDPARFVKVKCPTTGREYALGVPNNIKTCHEGVAWTFDMTPEEYNPVVET